MNKFSYQILQF